MSEDKVGDGRNAKSATEAAKERKKPVSQSDVPAYSLEQSLRIAQSIGENYAFRPTAPLDVAAGMELTPSSGHFRMLTGSSIAYGLTEGGYNSAQISVTALAQRVLRPTEEGDDDRARREAVLKPRIIREFLTKYEGHKLPREDIALNILTQMDVPRESTKKVLQTILEGAKAVGFLRDIKGNLYVNMQGADTASPPSTSEELSEEDESMEMEPPRSSAADSNSGESESSPKIQEAESLGKAIFIAHGKDKKPLEQLKKILDQFNIKYRVAIDEPNLGRPIGAKVRETLQACNCAILIFTADEEFKDKDNNVLWRPSENVVHELGAASYLYENRIVVMKEDLVVLPSNFRDIGYISFTKDQLETKAMEIIRELIGFGIVKIST